MQYTILLLLSQDAQCTFVAYRIQKVSPHILKCTKSTVLFSCLMSYVICNIFNISIIESYPSCCGPTEPVGLTLSARMFFICDREEDTNLQVIYCGKRHTNGEHMQTRWIGVKFLLQDRSAPNEIM